MLQRFVDREAFRRVHNDQFGDQILRFRGDSLPHRALEADFGAPDLLREQFRVERETSRHHEQQHAQTPHIDGLSIGGFESVLSAPLQNLHREMSRDSTSGA